MAGTLISGLLNYAFHFAVSRQISIAQYGELQSLLSAMLIFGVFNSALSYFTIRHTSIFAAHRDFEANREFINYLASRVFKITLLILLLLFAISPLLAHLLHFSSAIGFVIVSIAIFFSTMTIVYFEILHGWQKFFSLSLIGIAGALAKLVSGTILAFLSPKTVIVSLSFLISSFVNWHLAKYWSKKEIGIGNTPKLGTDWKNKYFSETNIRRSAIKIFFFSFALILVSNIDILLVKYFSSPETAGYYGAFALLGKIILWLNLSVASVLLPEACTDGHLGKRPRKKYLFSSYFLMILLALGITTIYYIAPKLVINIFFGNKYLFNAQILWLFGVMSFLLSILTLEANLSFAKQDFRVVYLLTATLILMIASLAQYHTDLRQIVLALSGSFLVGYILILILNLYHSGFLPFVKEKSEKDL